MENFKKAIITNKQNPYFGLRGVATYPVNRYGNVMFYPTGKKPYRVCVKHSEIQWEK